LTPDGRNFYVPHLEVSGASCAGRGRTTSGGRDFSSCRVFLDFLIWGRRVVLSALAYLSLDAPSTRWWSTTSLVRVDAFIEFAMEVRETDKRWWPRSTVALAIFAGDVARIEYDREDQYAPCS